MRGVFRVRQILADYREIGHVNYGGRLARQVLVVECRTIERDALHTDFPSRGIAFGSRPRCGGSCFEKTRQVQASIAVAHDICVCIAARNGAHRESVLDQIGNRALDFEHTRAGEHFFLSR